MHFRLGEDLVPGKQIDVFLADVMRQRIHGGTQIVKPAGRRFLHPFVRIVVAVEDDALMCGIILHDEIMQRRFKVLALLQLIGKLAQGLGDDGIQNVVGAGDIQR